MSDQTNPPKKDWPRGERYLKVFYCHGCQSCWNLSPDGETLEESQHVLSVEDVTDEVLALKAAQGSKS